MANPFLVLGGIAVGVVTAAFGVLQVPGWVASAQDASAINDLSIIADTQAVSGAADGTYAATLDDLAAKATGTSFTLDNPQNLLRMDVGDGTTWCAIVASESGQFFAGSSEAAGQVRGSTSEEAAAKANCGTKVTPEPTGFITFRIDTTAPGCVAPAINLNTPTGRVSWGDGAAEDAVNGRMTHTYTDPGVYDISLTGTAVGFRAVGDDAAPCIISVPEWYGTETVTAREMFAMARNLETVATPPAGLQSTAGMFSQAWKFNDDVSKWPMGSVATMSEMFAGTRAFNHSISDWDVSNVTDMSWMFNGASGFNQPINWAGKTGKLTDISGIFSSTEKFNQRVDWDTSNVTDMSSVFAGAADYNQPVNHWKTDNVTSFNSTFLGARQFNQSLSDWKTGNATTLEGMFNTAVVFNQPVNHFDTRKVESLRNTFTQATAFNQPLDNWKTGNVTTLAGAFQQATSFNQPLPWDTSNVTTLEKTFRQANAFNRPLPWNTSKVTTLSETFSAEPYDAPKFSQDISGWDVSAVENMHATFEWSAFDVSINAWNVSNVTDMSDMFAGSSFNKALDQWGSKVTNVRTMAGMFQSNITFSRDLSGWQTFQVRDMTMMFSGAWSFTMNLGSWYVGNVEHAAHFGDATIPSNGGTPNFSESALWSSSR